MDRINIVSFSDNVGGASIACKRQVSEVSEFNINWIVSKKNDSKSISVSDDNKISRVWNLFKRVISYTLVKLQFTNYSKFKMSLNLFSDNFIKNSIVNERNFHFHWVNNDTISLFLLKKILENPENSVIITLHDDWFISGTEHCLEYNDSRYIDGYTLSNASVLSCICFNVKKDMFQRSRCKLLITTPSDYLRDKVLESKILGNKRIVTIPNFFNAPRLGVHDLEVRVNGKLVNFSKYDAIFLVSSVTKGNVLKGHDFFKMFLSELNQTFGSKNVAIIRVGGDNEGIYRSGKYDLIDLGYIKNESELVKLYTFCDLTLVFSRSESFGQVALESLYCGTPVVAFDCTGISDFVIDRKNGFLVNPYDMVEYTRVVFDFICSDIEHKTRMSLEAKSRSRSIFDSELIGKVWKDTYNNFY